MASPKKIFVAGHRGMVGSAISRQLLARGDDPDCIITRSHAELILLIRPQYATSSQLNGPIKYLAAAKVGGIHANATYPADFIYNNIMIQTNVIDAAFHHGVRQLLFLGSSCIYPRLAPQPMCEDAILTGTLEPTNEPYAIAKIAGIKLCESYSRQYGTSEGVDYRSVMPTNLYGPGDNFHPENSHVIPALIRRFHEAKINHATSVSIWGTGTPRREFLYVDDMAAACLHVMDLSKAVYSQQTQPMLSQINVGSGHDITIRELAETIARVVHYRGSIAFDSGKPDGAPRKLIDSTRLNKLGWQPKVDLEIGLEKTYENFLKNYTSQVGRIER